MPYIGKPQSADPITVNTSNIDDGTIQAVDISSSFREHISGSFQGGGSNKISGSLTSTGSFGKVEVGSGKITTAGNMTLDADGAQIRFEDGGTEFGRISRVSSDLVIKSISNNNDILFKGVDGSATITALTLDMSEAGNATFNSGITATTGTITGDFSVGGTITAQEVHTEFESASVIFTSGSTIFGNSSDDIHNMTGSLNVSGGLDVDGTTNLDVVDIDGAVDMASTLTLGGRLTLSNAGSDPGIFLGGGWQIFDNASESFGTAGDLVFYHGASRMVIGDTGDVGIGTNNPQTGRLHIHNGDSGATSYVQLTQDGTGTSGTNGLLVGVNAAEASIIYNGENTPLIFYTNASERVRIDNSGNVGIGTNNPGVQLDIYNTDHAVMRLLAGTNKSASMRLKNDNQDWDVNCQTTDNFAIYDQTGGSAALIIESGGYNATFSGDVQISKSNAKLLVFDSTVGNKESIVIDRNTANGDDYQEIRWKLQGTNYPGGYIRHDYEDTNNSNLYFGVRDSGTPGTALTIDNSKNATFASMVKASFFRTDSQATSVANATWTDLNGLTNLSAGLYIIHAYKDNYAANDWSARGIVEATGHSTIDGDFENQSGFQLRVNGNDVQLYHTLGSTFGITVSWIKIG